jgi:hypothetical protein
MLVFQLLLAAYEHDASPKHACTLVRVALRSMCTCAMRHADTDDACVLPVP